ncbi:Vacuolar protein 8 [Heracleum sosnowskyi]|uniref:Vacuolar protein 8 n=1 Tax=Heracleum sosnowskyi TaxID=360622 RepID=A0AAD8HY14_9APIA|nr:Vacuolar protein 8 [Heracleum sosnowskyi]
MGQKNPPELPSLPAGKSRLRQAINFTSTLISLSYSTKSDLSVLACKIDTHIDCLSEICTVGLSTNSTVAQKPGALASIDYMKVYVKDLLSRLKVGDIHMKKQALLAFNQVIQEDEEHVEICMETDGIVSNLVNFLDSGVIDIQEESAKMACLISKFDAYRGELAGAGLIPPLIRVVECGSRVGQECAARCLMNMTEKSNYAWSVLAHDGVTVLLEIGRNVEACGSELVVLACGVLKNLGREEEINKFMVQEGALKIFITLAKSGNNVVLLSSIGCLQIMASTNELNRNLIVKEGGIFVLLDVLDPRSLISSEAREMALEAIMILCLESTSSLNIVMDYGFIDHILLFLQHGFSRVQELALKATVWLCEASEEAKMALGEAGFLLELVKFLNAKSLETRELAAKALFSMISVPKNRKRFVENQESVGVLVQLLDQEEDNSGDRKLLLSILMALTSSTSGRKRIVNSGYVQNIEKLADDEVIDAQKLFRKSTSNKISSILSQMWQ